jgi:hypothetical protein
MHNQRFRPVRGSVPLVEVAVVVEAPGLELAAVVAVGSEPTLELLGVLAAGAVADVELELLEWLAGEFDDVDVVEPASGSTYCWSPAEEATATAGRLSASTPRRNKQLTV